MFHTDSPTNAGGAGLYIANNLKAVPRPDIKFDVALVESCWAEIDASEGKKKIIIGCIYKHPRGVLPYMGYIGMCRCEGYGFQSVYSRIRAFGSRIGYHFSGS